MIRGSAASVAGDPPGWLCIRITGCVWLPPACARLTMRSTHTWAPEPAACQSRVSTDQFHTCIPREAARLSVVVLYAPYGGRKKHGELPTSERCWADVRSISAPCAVDESPVKSGCDQEWLPSAKSCEFSTCTRSGREVMFTPMLKKVPATPASSSTRIIAAVSGPGPSSKVRATVLPVPGAELRTPEPAAGQPAIAARAATPSGGATLDGSTARTSDGGCPASPGAACANGSTSAHTSTAAPTPNPTLRRRMAAPRAPRPLGHAPTGTLRIHSGGDADKGVRHGEVPGGSAEQNPMLDRWLPS